MSSPSPLLASLSLYTLSAFHRNNPNAQLHAVLSFTPTSPSSSPSPLGPLLLQSLFSTPSPYNLSSHPSHPCPPHPRIVAARVVAGVVRDNRECQRVLLKLPVGEEMGGRTVTWMERFIELVQSSVTPTAPLTADLPQVEVALLCLLCQWIDGCAEVVEALFARQSFLQHLITLATTHPNDYIRGLSTYTFLLCLHMLPSTTPPAPSPPPPHAPSPPTFLTPASLLQVIQQSMTLETFKSTILALHSSPALTAVRGARVEELSPFQRWVERRVRAGAELGEHAFVVDEGRVEEEEEESGVWAVVERSFVTRLDRVVEGMNDRLLSLLTTVLSSSSSSSSSSSNASAGDAARLLQDNQRLRTENEALRAQVQQVQAGVKEQHMNGGGGGEQLGQLRATIAHQREEIAALTQQLQELQQRQTDSRGSGPSSSLQRKFDELQAEHEDLLILLAQYAQAEEQLQQPSSSSTSASAGAAASDEGEQLTYHASGYKGVGEEEKTSQHSTVLSMPSLPSTSVTSNGGYYRGAATTLHSHSSSPPTHIRLI